MNTFQISGGLGEAFTPTLREAWTHAYTLLAEPMQPGAKQTMPA